MILREITGQDVRWADLGSEDVVCIGSILNTYVERGGKGAVLGSGVRSPLGLDAQAIPRSRVLGVRGTKTAALLDVSERVIGDPGLVMRSLVSHRQPSTQRRPLFVPHFTTLGSRAGRAALTQMRSRGCDVALPTEAPLDVATAVAKASLVIASSLHALVFADALGVPCARLAPETNEPSFKYDDYRSVFETGMSSYVLADLPPAAVIHSSVEREHAQVLPMVDSVVDRIYAAGGAL